jgi:hypothetical protein
MIAESTTVGPTHASAALPGWREHLPLRALGGGSVLVTDREWTFGEVGLPVADVGVPDQ